MASVTHMTVVSPVVFECDRCTCVTSLPEANFNATLLAMVAAPYTHTYRSAHGQTDTYTLTIKLDKARGARETRQHTPRAPPTTLSRRRMSNKESGFSGEGAGLVQTPHGRAKPTDPIVLE